MRRLRSVLILGTLVFGSIGVAVQPATEAKAADCRTWTSGKTGYGKCTLNFPSSQRFRVVVKCTGYHGTVTKVSAYVGSTQTASVTCTGDATVTSVVTQTQG